MKSKTALLAKQETGMSRTPNLGEAIKATMERRERERILIQALTFYAQKRNWVASDNGDGDLTRRLLCSDEHGYLLAQRALRAAR